MGVFGVLGVLGVRGVLGFAVDFFAVACVPPGESLMMSAGIGAFRSKNVPKSAIIVQCFRSLLL